MAALRPTRSVERRPRPRPEEVASQGASEVAKVAKAEHVWGSQGGFSAKDPLRACSRSHREQVIMSLFVRLPAPRFKFRLRTRPSLLNVIHYVSSGCAVLARNLNLLARHEILNRL